jgi:hypothetical protein
MAWGRKSNLAAPPPIPAKPERSPDEIISEMLSAYQEHFYTQAKGNSAPGIDEAKARVDRARRMIDESRIGYSLCAMADHTKPWHAWALRDDFQEHAGFPATNVSGHVGDWTKWDSARAPPLNSRIVAAPIPSFGRTRGPPFSDGRLQRAFSDP